MALRIIFAGGGTAGHIEPALAVADAIRAERSDAECIFLGTKNGLENLLVPKSGYQLSKIPKVAMPRTFSFSIVLFPVRIIRSILSAIRVVRNADLLIGFGGYISASAYIAAKLTGVPIVVHEANAKPGWANRLARNWARVVAVTFDEVRERWAGSILTGIPLRAPIIAMSSMKGEARRDFRKLHCESWGLDPAKPIIAIFGGSQGSQRINSVVEEFLTWEGSFENFQIIHAVGVNNPLPSKAPGYLPVPYFHDMAAIYGSADLLITRSGAVTCAEIATVGTYAILIPLPHGNGEQVTNAQSLVRQGRAISVSNEDFSATWLKEKLSEALSAAESTGSLPSAVHIGAATRIAQLALAEVEK